MITQAEFYKLPEIVGFTSIQKSNAFGSIKHRQAHLMILEVAKIYAVDKNKPDVHKTMEVYD